MKSETWAPGLSHGARGVVLGRAEGPEAPVREDASGDWGVGGLDTSLDCLCFDPDASCGSLSPSRSRTPEHS